MLRRDAAAVVGRPRCSISSPCRRVRTPIRPPSRCRVASIACNALTSRLSMTWLICVGTHGTTRLGVVVLLDLDAAPLAAGRAGSRGCCRRGRAGACPGGCGASVRARPRRLCTMRRDAVDAVARAAAAARPGSRGCRRRSISSASALDCAAAPGRRRGQASAGRVVELEQARAGPCSRARGRRGCWRRRPAGC